MRTAIRTYQSGGLVDPQQDYVPYAETPQAQVPITTPPVTTPVTPAPQQPSPAAAGQQTPALPPTTTTGQAIDTQPKQPEFDHDIDVQAWKENEDRAFNPKNVASHRGDNRYLAGEAPKAQKFDQSHPDWERLEQMRQLLPQIEKEDTSKTKSKYKTAFAMWDKQMKEAQRNIDNENKRASQDFYRIEKQEQNKADAKAFDTVNIANLDPMIDGGFAKQAGVLGEAGKVNPQARQKSERLTAMSPLTTMKEHERRMAARNIIALNTERNFNADDASRIIMEIATPPPIGQKGPNGARGRAAANYVPYGVDVVGNYIIQTSAGKIRVHPETFKMLKNAKDDGYNRGLKYEDDLAKRRADEAKDGWFTRTWKDLTR